MRMLRAGRVGRLAEGPQCAQAVPRRHSSACGSVNTCAANICRTVKFAAQLARRDEASGWPQQAQLGGGHTPSGVQPH
jgi:sulfite reductase beta subunit-like hemoprotein